VLPPTSRCSLEIAPHLRGSALPFRLPISNPRAAKQRNACWLLSHPATVPALRSVPFDTPHPGSAINRS
jgi:hypothetical protein